MPLSEKQLLVNKAVSDFKLGIKKLQNAKTLLEAAQKLQEAAAIDLCIVEMSEKLGGIKALVKSVKSEDGKKNLILQHPMQDYFHDIWQELFPEYGKLSSRDWKELKSLFNELENPNKFFIRRLIENYKKSTADWTNPKLVYVLARNWRRFVDGAVSDFNTQIMDRRDGVSNEKAVEGRRVAGIPGVYIPDKK